MLRYGRRGRGGKGNGKGGGRKVRKGEGSSPQIFWPRTAPGSDVPRCPKSPLAYTYSHRAGKSRF